MIVTLCAYVIVWLLSKRHLMCLQQIIGPFLVVILNATKDEKIGFPTFLGGPTWKVLLV